MNKRNGVFALALAAVLSFAGCGGGDNDDGGSQGSELPVSTGTDISDITDSSQSESTDTVIIIDTTVSVTTPREQTAEITTEPPHTDNTDVSSQIVQTAELLLGIPFENGFINCPRLTGEQAAMGTIIGYGELQSGDLAFFCTAESGNPDFGGIYIGSGQMIYCSMPGRSVETADISMDYWKKAFVSGVRLS